MADTEQNTLKFGTQGLKYHIHCVCRVLFMPDSLSSVKLSGSEFGAIQYPLQNSDGKICKTLHSHSLICFQLNLVGYSYLDDVGVRVKSTPVLFFLAISQVLKHL